MLDLRFIEENKPLVLQAIKKRGIPLKKANLDALLKFAKIRREKQQQLDKINQERKRVAKARLFEKGRALKAKAQDLEAELRATDKLILQHAQWVPNILDKGVPEGGSSVDNQVRKKWGEPKKFAFPVKDHKTLGRELGLLDIERGAKVAQSGFYFLRGEGARLAWALYNFALDFLQEKGFEQLLVPLFTAKDALFGTGYFPFISEESYRLDGENLYAIGTSEQPLVAIHQDEILADEELPKLYTAFSPCFRQEAGSYGKDVAGIFRVHQFHKVEQIVFCRPEESERWHQECLQYEEEMLQKLELPYRVVDVCAGDMGAPGYRKYDCEVWFPSQRKYREVTSNTNLTDFQTRRLRIRARTKQGKKYYPHTISATGVTDRWLIAIWENYQREDGSIVVPVALRKYVNRKVIKHPSANDLSD